MTTDNERRNRLRGELRMSAPSRRGSAPPEPLGGRHGTSPLAGPGGGSPSICNKNGDAIQRAGVDADHAAGVDKLRRIGLLPAWIDVAEAIGFEMFLVAWRALSNHDALDGRGRIVVPLYSHFTRFERNEYVRGLLAAGKTDREIIAAVKRNCREDLTPRSLSRIKRTSKLQSS